MVSEQSLVRTVRRIPGWVLIGIVGIVGFAAVALVTTLPGIGLRGFAAYMQKEPFLVWKTEDKGKSLPLNRTFSLLSWNVCCTAGGYSISDGGVMPWASPDEFATE